MNPPELMDRSRNVGVRNQKNIEMEAELRRGVGRVAQTKRGDLLNIERTFLQMIIALR